jgi:hypothetical protein
MPFQPLKVHSRPPFSLIMILYIAAVTSRLEDVATATTGTPLISQTSTAAVHNVMASHAPIAPSASSTPAPAASKQDAPASPAVQSYQTDLIGGPLQEYLQKSSEVGGLVAEHVGPIIGSSANSPVIYGHRLPGSTRFSTVLSSALIPHHCFPMHQAFDPTSTPSAVEDHTRGSPSCRSV